MQQYVEGFRYTRSWHIFTFNNCFVSFSTTNNVIRLDSKHFLKNVCCTECFQCPNLHLTKTLTTELCFTTQRLLSNKRVRSDRTCVHLIVNKVSKFQHVNHPNSYRLIETMSG